MDIGVFYAFNLLMKLKYNKKMKRSKFMRNGRKARRCGTRLISNIQAYNLHAINKQTKKCINTYEKEIGKDKSKTSYRCKCEIWFEDWE